MNRVEVKIKIPEELKPWLFDDWDLITWQKQLFYLPAKKNVDSILEDYANYKTLKETQIVRSVLFNGVLERIKEYFSVKLGTQPLYTFEKPEYSEILADLSDAPMSQVYGAPHLLRPFVWIGTMLAYMPLDDKSCFITELSKWFPKISGKNVTTLFSASTYEVASPEYHQKAVWGIYTHLCLDLCKLIFVF